MAVLCQGQVVCRSEIQRLWNAITDTDRFNRILGMSRVSARPHHDTTAARFLVNTSLGGLPVEYEERPFEWVYPRTFRILRRMRSGMLRQLELAYVLEPHEGGGTRVSVHLTLEPRTAIVAPLVRFSGGRSLRDIQRAIARIDASLTEGTRLALPSGALSKEAFAHAQSRLLATQPQRLHPLCERMLDFVASADDLDVSRIRPFALADAWHEDRYDTLHVCLAAVRAGLLDLRWEVACPSCRIATNVLPTLALLSEHSTCHLCDLAFLVDLEDAVEATFAPAQAVREADHGRYCMGGPARTPHVLAQAILPAGGRVALECPRDPGRYRLFVRGGHAAPVEVRSDAPREVGAGDWSTELAQPIRVAPGGSLVVGNATPDERHVKIERPMGSDQSARARVVTTMAGFRRDFSKDVLRSGLALKVARVGLLFSDLTGSTQLYSDVGDATAFKLVQDHFDLVVRLVEENRGALVKTIGDAVMAVFPDDLQGLLAGLAILRGFEVFRRTSELRHRTHIKLGVYGGACYAVTANQVMDYFGQSVNIAARLQGEAKGGELVVESHLADWAMGTNVLPASWVVERLETKLKGVAEPLTVARIRVVDA